MLLLLENSSEGLFEDVEDLCEDVVEDLCEDVVEDLCEDVVEDLSWHLMGENGMKADAPFFLSITMPQ
jgi:hypothetical protein